MNIHKIAAIDIGSNSVRLLVANVLERGTTVIFKKSSLTRLPIRLGEDSFGRQAISEERTALLETGMEAYQKIMAVHGVSHYRACATSALREARNGPAVVERIRQNTGVGIELIDGQEEARLIFQGDFLDNLKGLAENFLYIDVGGGSTELTLFEGQKPRASRSFPIGTIRLLQDQVKPAQWQEMTDWIQEHTAPLREVMMVGSGGNINRTFKLSEKKKGQPISLAELLAIKAELEDYDREERMIRFDLNPDRSDVITHALAIYTRATEWAGADQMIVPKKGLADGMVRDLYGRYLGDGG
ncbi:MAG: exopolyphosphatase [Schleiferiaceae bacterium]|nr:exopolyphosphatase [Schleiferiaceae bacterium]